MYPRPLASRSGRNSFISICMAMIFTSSIPSSASRSVSSKGPKRPSPALFTRISMFSPCAARYRARHPSRLERSAGRIVTRTILNSEASALSRSSRRAVSTRSQPRAARTRAISLPIPELAPVTSAFMAQRLLLYRVTALTGRRGCIILQYSQLFQASAPFIPPLSAGTAPGRVPPGHGAPPDTARLQRPGRPPPHGARRAPCPGGWQTGD